MTQGMPREERRSAEACRLFMHTDRMHRRLFERMVTELGIHRSQHFLLMHLARGEVGSQKALADRLDISTAAVAVALKKLESGGYIERRTAEGDSRNNEICITEEGQRVVAASRNYIARLDEAMFRGMDDHTLTVFVQCLETMQKNLCEFEAAGKEDKR